MRLDNQTLTKLQQLLRRALQRRDYESVRLIRQRIELVRAETSRKQELLLLLAPFLERIELAIVRGQSVVELFRELEVRIVDWFARALRQTSVAMRTNKAQDLAAVMSPAQLRRSFKAQFDVTGKPVMAVGQLPAMVPGNGTAAEVLLAISPLVHAPGNQIQAGRTPVEEMIAPRRESVLDVVRPRPEVAGRWQDRLRAAIEAIRQELVALQRSVIEAIKPIPELLNRLRDRFGLKREGGGIAGRLLNELRHEGLRVGGDIDQEIYQRVDSVIGYRLNSRFLPTTAADHAARDGVRFYKDDREGSYLPWSQRLIPPYRKNCVCFTTPILEAEPGLEYEAEFGVRVSRDETITVRDVGTFQDWFNGQPPGVQRRLVGDQAWFAVSQHGQGKPRWEQFFQPNGDPVSAADLAREDFATFELRSERARIVMGIQSRRVRTAWAEGNGRFDSSPDLEDQYRDELAKYLKRLGVS